MKKYLCLLLSILFIAGLLCLPVSASAVSCEYCTAGEHPKTQTSKDGNYTYVKWDDEIHVIAYKGEITSEFVFPEEIDGINVTEIGEIYCSNYDEASRQKFFKTEPQTFVIPKNIKGFSSLSVDFGREYFEWIKTKFSYNGEYYADSYFPLENQPKEIIVEEGNTAFTVMDNALYSKDMTILYKYWGNDDSFEVPDTVKIIARYAFAYSTIKNVKLPENLDYIASDAFYGSAIESVKTPKTIYQINERTFENCENLKTLELTDGLQYIKAYAFKNCTALKEIILPKSLLSCEYNAFQNCEIEKCTALCDYIPLDKTFETCDIYTEYELPKKVASISFSSSGRKTTSLKISWQTQGGVNGYCVYIKESGEKEYKCVVDLKGSIKGDYTITGLEPATKYDIKVRAYRLVDGKEKFGEYSKVLTVETKAEKTSVKNPVNDKKPSGDVLSPQTNDNSFMYLCIALVVLFITGSATIFIRKKLVK